MPEFIKVKVLMEEYIVLVRTEKEGVFNKGVTVRLNHRSDGTSKFVTDEEERNVSSLKSHFQMQGTWFKQYR